MESAWLNRDVIHLERERSQLLRQGLSAESAREALEAKYRIYSREKGAFSCACCGSRVVMVLYEDKAIFRHYDSEACAGERNYARYTAGLEKAAELALKHAQGKEAVRRILQVLQSGGYSYEEGYLFKKELRSVPDFMITLPDGQRWAVDYIVSLKGDASYRRRLRSRLAGYRANGFKPLFMIDRSWLAMTESAYISFNLSELEMRTPANPYDELWRRALREPPLSMTEPVYSLVYLDTEEETAVLARFQMSGDRWGRLLFPPAEIPLDHLLAVDERLLKSTGTANLQLFKIREEASIEPYRDRLIRQLQEEERERAEHAARQEALRERLQQLREASLSAGIFEAASAAEPAAPKRAVSSEQLTRIAELLERCKRSPRRPDYPGLEDHLARAEALLQIAAEELDGAAESYKAAWSLLQNIRYPLLGE